MNDDDDGDELNYHLYLCKRIKMACESFSNVSGLAYWKRLRIVSTTSGTGDT